MNKRIRRKVHRKFLFDVVYEVSISHRWRELLFKAQEGEKFRVDSRSTATEPGLRNLHRILSRFNLKYFVSKVPKEEEPNWEGWEGYTYFRFQAVEFPETYDFSVNNPDSI